jgi:nucleoside-diphosphate-sugar epimerase
VNLLITGGLGFIGTEVLKILNKRKDIKTTVFDNLMHFQDLPLARKRYPTVDFIVGDIRHRSALHSILPKFDIVLHLAAIVGTPACKVNTRFAYDVNVGGTYNVVSGVRRDQKLILLSSTSAYGDRAGEVVNERSALTPLTEYGVHKKIDEIIANRYSDAPVLVLRPATAFGGSDHMRLDVLPNTLAFDGLSKHKLDIFQPEVTRTFIHVTDLARAFVYAVDSHLGWNTSYNVGNPKLTMTKGEMAKKLAKLTFADITIHDGEDPDKRNYDIDFSKLLNRGFNCRYGFTHLANEMASNINQLKENPVAYSTAYRVEKYLLYKD